MLHFTFRELVLALAFAALAAAWTADRFVMNDALNAARARASQAQTVAADTEAK